MKILCLIPARSGSEGIPNKNIKIFHGHPLLSWSIRQAQKSSYEMKIVVSTDSEEYSKIASQYHAEVPFLRPTNISGKYSTDLEVFQHCLMWLKENQEYVPDIVLHLRPTQPCRKISDIDECLRIFIENYKYYDSLRTVVPSPKSPYKMYTISDNKLNPIFKDLGSLKEPYNQARQLLPDSFIHNGYIDIFKSSLVSDGTISGEKIYPYIMESSQTIDIDNLKDWDSAEKLFSETLFL